MGTIVHTIVRLILLFVTILQKYTSTLRIVWTRRCCFYHESKMGMTPQRLLSVVQAMHEVFQKSCEYYIQCSLYMHNMLLRRLNIRHMRNKWRAVNIYILPPVRQFSFYRIPCSASLFCMNDRHVTGLFHSRVNLMVLFLCCSLSANN